MEVTDYMTDRQKERLNFVFTFYCWVLGALAFLALTYLMVAVLAQVLGIEAVSSNPVFVGMITLGIFWVLTVLQCRGVLVFLTQWGIGQSVRMYHCAQLGLLPPTLRKVNQYKVPLVLIGAQRSIVSIWFFVQTLFLATALNAAQFTSYIIFMVLSLLALIALPFWIYSRHDRSKHKTIVLPPSIEISSIKVGEVGSLRFVFLQLRAKYHIQPAKEDYLPFSKQRKLVREQQEAARMDEEEHQAQNNRQTAQPEQVVEADEIEYAD